ncbi:hypothetical protein LTS18_003124 [Coniosporium uncinatum]|uniref:Uncharacterized protein n=1 Tax=Coniosporium uncinatum TaxID=93489 RepID=A0ACC3DTI8_9PEZI|nr:hypothetical protein LTS18_003124 [Coniosporium uncinatum]
MTSNIRQELTGHTRQNYNEYPKGTKLALITTALVPSIFLSALDSTIITTAIPKITDAFGSLDDIGWYGSAFSLTNVAFISTWGKAYNFFPLRSTFVLAIAIFEIRNLITGAAPNSPTLIAGRAIAGLGSAGTMTGAFIIIAFTVPPELRTAYMSVLGVTFGCSSVIEPLMGAPPVIDTLSAFVVLRAIFILNEHRMGSRATVQPHFLHKPAFTTNVIYIFFLAGLYFPLYSLPIRFHSLDAVSASISGVHLIPLVLGISLFTMVSNGLISYFGRGHLALLVLGGVAGTVGAGLIYSLDQHATTTYWIGYEFLAAMGIGVVLQIPTIANQALVPACDIAAATATTLFVEKLGTALFVAAEEAALKNRLVQSVGRYVPDLDPALVVRTGATRLRMTFGPEHIGGVLLAYLEGCKVNHALSLACGGAAAGVALAMAMPVAVRDWRARRDKPHAR